MPAMSPTVSQNATIFAGYGGLAQKQGMKADRLSNNLIKYFVEDTDPATFGFINPADIVCAVHLIPSFQDGKRNDILSGPSVTQSSSGDWSWYYINQ